MLSLFCAMIDTPENRSKFQVIYERYKNTMYSVAFNISKNKYTAEDIVQTSAIKLIRMLDKIEFADIDTAKCKNLMITIAKHTAIDFMRRECKQSAAQEYEYNFNQTAKSAEDVYFESKDFNQLIRCIDELDEKYRDVLRLRVVNQLSSREIAEVLNISEHNVNIRFMRAKQILSKKIKEQSDVR